MLNTMLLRPLGSLAVAVLLVGCATPKAGDKSVEAELKKFAVSPQRVSLYVCRQDTFNQSGVDTDAYANSKNLGTLRPGTFAHTLLEAGEVSIFLRRNGVFHQAGDSGTLKFTANAGDVRIIWAGPAGFMGVLTVDHFPSVAEGRACVKDALYVVQ
jgi:hypothetical protein